MNSKQKANIGIGKAIEYYTGKNYTVSIPLNDSQAYDLIVDVDGVLKKVQVKYTTAKTVGLRSISGSSRKEYSRVNRDLVDLLFVVKENVKYEFIVSEIDTKTIITLNHTVLNRMVGREA